MLLLSQFDTQDKRSLKVIPRLFQIFVDKLCKEYKLTYSTMFAEFQKQIVVTSEFNYAELANIFLVHRP